jgi:endonuclease/exonuclease/phosphatase family metal-dependent hydrolase
VSGDIPLRREIESEMVVERLTVVSYNTHRCTGRDGVCDPRRVVDLLGPVGAQLIALQELHSDPEGDATGDQAGFLARELGMEVIRGPTLFWGRREYGNALLTSLPILSVARIDLSAGGRCEPRGAVDAQLGLGAAHLRAIVTHLGLRWWERRRQLDQLAATVQHDDAPVIVLGDLNEWRAGAHRTLRRLDPHMGPYGGRSPRTFPATFPLLRLDRILVRPADALIQLDAIGGALARVTSDHLPLRGLIDAQRLTQR